MQMMALRAITVVPNLSCWLRWIRPWGRGLETRSGSTACDAEGVSFDTDAIPAEYARANTTSN